MSDVVALAFKWVVGLGVTATVAASAAYAAFQLLGKKWLEARFAERLERFKHDQQQEIERLRYRINALMDRTTKLHQHEFAVLPQVWDKLNIAFSRVVNFTSPMQSYPDLARMADAQFLEFVDKADLDDWEKEDLRHTARRNDRYQELIFWHNLHYARTSYAEFHNYLVSKGIFIQPELKDKIRGLSEALSDALFEKQMDKETGERTLSASSAVRRLRSDGPKTLEAIERDVQARLWEANKLD